MLQQFSSLNKTIRSLNKTIRRRHLHKHKTKKQSRNEGISFKNILQGGKSPTVVPKQPSPYIVEQPIHQLNIDIPETYEVCNNYESQAMICPIARPIGQTW